LPIDPREYPRVLNLGTENAGDPSAQDEDILELQSISTAFGHLSQRRGLSPQQRTDRNREKEVQKRRLAALCQRSERIRNVLQQSVQSINGNSGDPRSFDALHELIKAQAYRLAYWRVAGDDINYRRFFDINDLAALCMENDTVFERTHRYILELIAKGKVNGLRIDHPDGLYDPKRYLVQLRGAAELAHQDAAEGVKPIYIVVEKILTGNENLCSDWPVQGTTGYEFASLVNGLFVESGSSQKMERIYRAFTGRSAEFSELVYKCKKLILKTKLASELNVLANLLNRIALSDRHTCDFTLHSLRSALADIIANFPVYRTYISDGEVSAEDRRYIEKAVATALNSTDAADLTVFDFIRRCLLLETNAPDSSLYKHRIVRFAIKFQQVTAAVMAKGLEDTAFYRYYRLVSLNDVGGNPGRFGNTVDDFHLANQQRAACWPNSMLASSTHDSKRSEDVRARINVLSEIPALLRLALRRWEPWNRPKKRLVNDLLAPNRNDEYLLYQTLIGMWPGGSPDNEEWKGFTQRIEQYMIKAAREAKEHTSWVNTRADYEDALVHFVRAVLERCPENRFFADFDQFHRSIARAGLLNSLSQSLLKLTSPGVPDIYQGNEMLDLSLVDPDNRGHVDYEKRRVMLNQLKNTCPEQLKKIISAAWSSDHSSAAKLWLISKTLALRKREADLFESGRYIPLEVVGECSQHVCAFERSLEGRSVIVIAPRLWATLLGESKTFHDPSVWRDTRVRTPQAVVPCYSNVLTAECASVNTEGGRKCLAISEILRSFPVAVLVNQPCPDHARTR
jgi:(1->4)-alpha-D-glucan 1-alpha-D-glucosylmutase